MDEAKRNHLADLLTKYYEADTEDKAERLADEILKGIASLIKARLRQEGLSANEVDELHADISVAIYKKLKDSRKAGQRINNLIGYLNEVVWNCVAEEMRKGRPKRRMQLRIRYIVAKSSYKDQFAIWQVSAATLVGLNGWTGRLVAKTERYLAFCRDDTAFVHHGLNGRNPAIPGQIELWELMLKLLEWIETPLELKTLTDHLLALLPVMPEWTVSVEDIPEAELLTPTMNETTLDLDIYWQAIRDLGLNKRRVMLLQWDTEQLALLAGQIVTKDLLAEVLGFSPEVMEQLWNRLPLKDAEIAQYLNTSVSYVQGMRSQCRARIRKNMGQ